MRLNSGNSTELTALQELIRRGPLTVVLVFTNTCPHCQSYKPLWRELTRTPGRQANMVSMEAATYDKTPLASQKPVSGVPTVLFVDTEGRITEAEEPRNREAMANTLRTGSPAAPAPAPAPADDIFEPISNAPSPDQELQARMSAVLPGSEVMENPLEPMPASTQQQGGNPWAAFLQAAVQAAPAAALLGAYSALPRRRRRTATSSGLPRLGGGRRRSRRTQRRSRKQK